MRIAAFILAVIWTVLLVEPGFIRFSFESLTPGCFQNKPLESSCKKSKCANEKQEEEKLKTVAGYRSVIGKGMRSEKIRTYNYPQDRITDHRLGKSWGNLEVIVDGSLDKVIELTKTIQV